jgi:cobalt/nickel transport system permease protein
MHIPDGILDLKTSGAAAALSLPALWTALRRLRLGMPRRRIPLMGLAAAFIFVAQMVNFPVAGGTSGHLLGAVLAAVLLGPSAAIVVMTAVVLVQCLLFADGGLLALGANVFNMAVAGVVGGYGVFAVLRRVLAGRRGFLIATAFASWCSTLLASLCCAGELASSRVAPWGAVFPAMVNVHMLIGVGEAVITSLVVVAIERTRPDLLEAPASTPASRSLSRLLAYALLLLLGITLFVVPFASSQPDGLERVAERLGFAGRALPSALPAPMPEYRIPGIGSATAATYVAVLVGGVIVFLSACLLATVLVPRSGAEDAPAGQA